MSPPLFLPKSFVQKSFLAGIIFTLPAALMQQVIVWLLTPLGMARQLVAEHFIIIALPEEITKMTAICILKKLLQRKNKIVDINLIFLAFIMAMAFALTENIFYFLRSQSPLLTVIIRSITALPLHTLCSGIIALGLLPALPHRKIRFNAPIALLIATAIHGFYNLILKQKIIHISLVFLFLVFAWSAILYYSFYSSKAKTDRNQTF